MTRDIDVDRILDGWFAEGPTQLPDRTVAAIARELDERRQRAPRRFVGGLRMPAFAPVLASAALVLVIGVVAVGLGRRPATGVTPSPHPLPAAPGDWSRVVLETALHGKRFTHIVAGPHGLVAVATSDEGARHLLYSKDGHDWAVANVSPGGVYVGLVSTDSGFLMTVSEDGAWASEDGRYWHQLADNWSGDPDTGGSIVVDVAAGGPGYVAIGNNNSIWWSSNGITWTPADVPPPPALTTPEFPTLNADLYHVAAHGEHVVATGTYEIENPDAGGGSWNFVLASRDGRTWSRVTAMGDRGGGNVVAVPDGFLVIGEPLDGETGWPIWHSTDGEAWELLGSYAFGGGPGHHTIITGIAATTSGYVAVVADKGCDLCTWHDRLWTSPDGRSWSEVAEGEPFDLAGSAVVTSVSANGSDFVVGGGFDDRPAIWLSGGN